MGNPVTMFIKFVSIINNLFYCVLLLTVFGRTLSGCLATFEDIDVSKYSIAGQVWTNTQQCSLYGGLIISVFTIKFFYPSFMATVSRLAAFLLQKVKNISFFYVLIEGSIYQWVHSLNYLNIQFFSVASVIRTFRSLPCLVLINSFMSNFSEERFYVSGKSDLKIQWIPGYLFLYFYVNLLGILGFFLFYGVLKSDDDNLIYLFEIGLDQPQFLNALNLILIGIPALFQTVQYGYFNTKLIYFMGKKKSAEVARARLYAYQLVQLGACTFLSILFHDIGDIITFLGASTQNFLSILIPSMLYLGTDQQRKSLRYLSIFLIAFSLLFMVITLFAEIWKVKEI